MFKKFFALFKRKPKVFYVAGAGHPYPRDAYLRGVEMAEILGSFGAAIITTGEPGETFTSASHLVEGLMLVSPSKSRRIDVVLGKKGTVVQAGVIQSKEDSFPNPLHNESQRIQVCLT